MKIRQIIGLAALLIGIVAVIATITLNKKSETAHGKITVTASFYPLYEFAKQIGGDKIEVTNVTPAGAEPHDYEPSPQTLVAAQTSQLFIYNGGTMEPWVDKFLPDFTHTAIKASDHIQLQTNDAGRDPHFWLDPILAQQIIKNIRDGLGKVDPAHKDIYAKNADSYIAQLAKLDFDFKDGLKTCKTRTIVTSHDAFGYFGRRYTINVTSIAGIDPDQEPSVTKLAELTQLVKSNNITYVFFESLVSPRLAATIAQETGAQTAVFDPIEGISDDAQKAGKNYIAVQRNNLAALRLALACQ